MQVRTHNRINCPGLSYHPSRHSVHKLFVPREIRESLCSLCDNFIPQNEAVSLSVGLTDNGKVLSWASVSSFEGVLHDTLDAVSCEDTSLGSHFPVVVIIRSSAMT